MTHQARPPGKDTGEVRRQKTGGRRKHSADGKGQAGQGAQFRTG